MTATCLGEAVCGRSPQCGDCRPAPDPAGATGSPAIPVRRYGVAPPPPSDEPGWEIETVAAPRTIAEHGAGLVLLAAIAAAVLGGWLLYCR